VRSDFDGQGFCGFYEPPVTHGPLSGAPSVGAPKIIPKELKAHLDTYVVGQERAKKKLSTAIYNHYQRIEELRRREREEEEAAAQQERRERSFRHPVEDEYPGQQATVQPFPPPPPPPPPGRGQLKEHSVPSTEKSNVLLLGPSGVGKTLMVKTLARVLDVPFSISNCTAFTMAGYVGEDAETCIHRLLAAANYDVAAAERGIVILDEIDKIATAKMAHGKDVGGEGVQQALLSIIEGTSLQIPAKPDKGRPSASMDPRAGAGKGDVYTVRTDNILFICAGAFVNLNKIILDRISKGSMGFNASVRSSKPEEGVHETMLKGEDALFKKHLPFYVAPAAETAPTPDAYASTTAPAKPVQSMYNMLDLVEPADLQKYGMIPELIGRIPNLCSVSALDEEALVRVLTEPKNSLIKQYEQLFHNSGIELRFTSGALREIAKRAVTMGTGARGLRNVLERLLEDTMFETPGSYTKHVLITAPVARLQSAPLYFQRGQAHSFNATYDQEEDEWADAMGLSAHAKPVNSFQEYRRQGLVAGMAGSL